MKTIVVVLLGMVVSSVALAAPPTFVEGALIFGGENNSRNGAGEQNGIEFVGSWGINQNWYAGGVLGYYDRDQCCENTYLNVNGGYATDLNENTSLNFEGGLWFGDEDANNGPTTKPKAIEAKVGINHTLVERLDVFATMSLVHADLDSPANDDLSNFIYSLGGAYAFTDAISMNVKMVNGENGVNGQDQVLRVGGRYAF